MNKQTLCVRRRIEIFKNTQDREKTDAVTRVFHKILCRSCCRFATTLKRHPTLSFFGTALSQNTYQRLLVKGTKLRFKEFEFTLSMTYSIQY